MKFQRISFASLSLLLGAGACSSSSHNDMASIDGDVPAMESQVDPSTRQTIQLTQDEQIPSAPFQAHGGLMNAFYFVRESHENWESISQKLYGRSDRQDLLAKWNNNRPIVVGALIYYNSPTRPEDTQQMLSFAEDFGYTLEQHVVESGDWLSKIALQKYGHIDNWREISALNPEITNPNLIQVGQSIKLSPLVVDTARVLSALIARQQNLVEQSEHVEHPQQAIEPAQAIATPSEPNEEIPAKAKTSSFDSWELLLAAFVVTCSVLLWIRRRKQLTPDHNPQFPEKTEQIRTENTARFTIIPGSAPKSSVDHAASRLPEKKIS